MDSNAIPYIVEDMTLADVPAVAALEQISFSLPWSIHAFEYEVHNNPMAHFLVVRLKPSGMGQKTGILKTTTKSAELREARSILGYAGLWLIVDEAHICTLAVHPDWRGHGLGELLLTGLIDRAIALGAAVATLEVRVSNLVAQNLYQKYGFAKVGLRKGYYMDNHEDALIMTTDLLSSAVYQQRFQALKAALRQRLATGS